MSNAGAGVFVAAVVVLLVSRIEGWDALTVVAGAVMIGVVVTTLARRRQG